MMNTNKETIKDSNINKTEIDYIEDINNKNTISNNKKINKTERNSNFEILRIVCMLLIVTHHLCCHGGINNVSAVSSNVFNAFIIGGKIGVNIFVLISAYFLVKSNFRLTKILKVIATVWFYSVSLYFLSLLLTGNSFNSSDFIKYLFPIIQKNYWFMTTYCVLYFLTPMLNIIINKLNRKQHLLAITLLIAFYLLFLILTNNSLPSIFWFIILYFIGAYIRLYPNKIFDNNKIILPITIISYLIILLTQIIWQLGFYGMDNIFVVINSIALFLVFKNIHIKTNKILNYLASTTFAIYIIHEHPALRYYIWQIALDCDYFASQPHFWLYAVFAIFTVYVVSTIIAILVKETIHLLKYLLHKSKRIKSYTP